MVHLLLAITCSALISFNMRLGEKYIRNNMVMFAANYTTCLLLARYYMGDAKLLTLESGIFTAVGLGTLCGILYLVNFVLLQTSMRHNGIVMSSTFMKLGVLVPTVMAILIFREQPNVMQIVGMAAALAAVIMIQFDKDADQKATDSQGKLNGVKAAVGRRGLLLILLLLSGFSDSIANIYDKTGVAALKDHYLFSIFLAALTAALLMALKEKKKFGPADLLFGVIIGIPNYFASRFLLLALGSVPAVITYPFYSVGTIVLISIAGAVFFKERISRQKKIALLLIIFSLILLNI